MDFEKLASAVQTIDGTVKNVIALQTSIQDTYESLQDFPENPSNTVTDFLKSRIGDKKDLIMRKAMAAAMVIAQENGLIASPCSDASELASVIDDGLTRVKTAYQVGVGTLEPEEAIDVIVDAAEARVMATIDKAFESGAVNRAVTNGIIKIAHIIPKYGKVIGPLAEKYKPVISAVISRVEEPVRKVIKTGVHIVASTAKTVARAAVSTVKMMGRSVAKSFRSIFA